MKPVTRVDVTPGSTGWQDVDVTSHVGGDAGSVALVMLEIVNGSTTEHSWGIRKNGSSDTLTGILEDTGHTWIAIGVDSSDIFEINLDNITDQKVYLVGYATTAEAGNLTNAVLKTVGTAGTWTDIDISSDTGGDTALVAFFKVKNTAATEFRFHGLRENGSSFNRPKEMYNGDIVGFAMSCDGSEVLEGYAENTADIDWYLAAWLTDNVTTFTALKDYAAAGSGSNEDVDVSADVPSGNDGAFFVFAAVPGNNTEHKALLIKKGSGITEYQDLAKHATPWVELDSDRIAEQKVESTALDLFLWGYTKPAAAGGTLFTVDVAGAITPAGALVQQPQVVVAGSIAPAGVLIDEVQTSMEGSVTPAGSLTDEVQTSMGGSVTPSGALSNLKLVLLSIAGAITPSGVLVSQARKAIAGVVAPAGALAQEARSILAGALTPAGALVNQVQTSMAGSITPSGALIAIRTILLTVAGAIAPAGAVVLRPAKALAGSITATGALTKAPQVLLAGTITPAGGLVKRVGKLVAGAIAAAGALAATILGISRGTVTISAVEGNTVAMSAALFNTAEVSAGEAATLAISAEVP